MKLRVIALILVIPILLIFTTSSVTKTVEILVDVPVKSVTIADIEQPNVDIASGQGVAINVTVEPSNASNANVLLADEATLGKEDNRAQIVVKDGVVYPITAGNVTIKASAGEKFDTVDLYFYSSKPMDSNVVVKNEVLTLKEGATMNAADNFEFKTDKPTDIEYSVDDASVVSVNKVFGNMKVLTPGETFVRVKYDGIKVADDGTVSNKTFEHAFKINATIDTQTNTAGVTTGSKEVEWFADVKNEQSATFYFWYDTTRYTFEDFALDCGDVVSNAKMTDMGAGKVKVDFEFYESAKEKVETSVVIKTTSGEILKEQIVSFDKKEVGDPSKIDFYETGKLVIAQKSRTNFQTYSLIVDQDGREINTDKYYAICTSSDENVLKATYVHGGCLVIGVDDGVANINVSLKRKTDDIEVVCASFSVEVVKPFENLSINSQQMSVRVNPGALDSVVLIGYYSFNESGQVTEYNSINSGFIPVSGMYSNASSGFDSSKVTWTSTDENVAKVEDGRLVLGSKSGEVTLTVKNNITVGVAKYDNTTASLKVNVVGDGVNVSNETELLNTWKEGTKSVVLTHDIRIATDVDKLLNEKKYEEAYKRAAAYLKSMETTGEATFYINNDNRADAKISYLIEITTDLYGNGYSIDADALTRQIAVKNGNPLFKGPLNLVAYGNGTQNASVKAQDNIVFLVQKDGIGIHNVELKGCSDSSILNDDNSSVNLSNLDLVGTVLEIVGDNCSVSYSRINNGRTVVRIYGKANPKTESSVNITSSNADDYRVKATINNSILSYGREFILKIGTNFTKKTMFDSHEIDYLGSGYSSKDYKYLYDEASPYLTKEDGTNYAMDDSSNVNDEYFYNNYVLTDVTLENCVFKNAGLFSVGLDSMFGGLCLHGFSYSENFLFGKKTTYTDPGTNKQGIGWAGVAGTSYPAVLRLKGDVRFYDWKQLSQVNSDTLIEGTSDLLNTIGLNMNVSALIDNFAKGDNASIVLESQNKKYVNGAIAFYGGGKNYSIVDTSAVNDDFESLHSYSVPVENFISQGNAVLINYTAGAEPFRFCLYDNSSTLGIAKQETDLSDGSAYNWLMR